jgi:hypothetical protein
MTTTYLLIAVFAVWSARSIQSAWRAVYSEKLCFSADTEISTAALALSAFYLATKFVGWS